MLFIALINFVLAILSYFIGFTNMAPNLAVFGRLLFFFFLFMFIITLIAGLLARRKGR